jgi:dephospho-CoA kinase
MRQEIEDAFGYTMDESGIKRLTQDIFSNDDKRKILNRIIHPRVFKRIEDLKEELYHEPIIMIDMPLLIEVGYQKEVDITVLVYVDQQTQLKRLIARDHLSENDAYMRINSQMSLEEKKAHADVILDNRSDTHQLEKQIISFLNSLKHEE